MRESQDIYAALLLVVRRVILIGDVGESCALKSEYLYKSGYAEHSYENEYSEYLYKSSTQVFICNHHPLVPQPLLRPLPKISCINNYNF